ncbi:MAG: phage terminase large subunit, partial [Caldilineaceae bacterium]
MPPRSASQDKADLATFFAIWAEERGWDVPDVHWLAVHWLEHRAELAVLRCFRGFGKSTLLAIYNAWRFYRDPAYRILHQGDQDRTAFKTSRDTKAVLQRHPLTRDAFAAGIRGEASFWWVPGSLDERNPSMQAAGIT